MPKENQHPFFVYGTLLPNQPNFSLWGDALSQMEPATLHGGLLYDMGFYPMLVAAHEKNAVHGRIVQIHSSKYEAVRQRLDALEGYDPTNPNRMGYRRQAVEVVLQDGRFQTAWAYMGQAKLVTHKPVIQNGDWAAHAAQNQPNLEEWWQEIFTVAHLHGRG